MELDKYLGHSSQMYGVTPFTYSQGKAKGVRAFEVKNGNGLEMKILEDRGLDVASLSFKGTNLSYLSKCGIVAPEYYSARGFDFLQNFYVGFLTTCGLKHIGAPCVCDGEEHGLHGKISNIPAEETCAYVDTSCGDPVIKVGGFMRESRIFQQNLLLRREYVIPVGGNGFVIRNRVENIGFKKEPYMLMLHINFGYPLLSGKSELFIPSLAVEPRDDDARKGFDSYRVMEEPYDSYPEQVFFHSLKADSDGNTAVALVNREIGIGVVLRYNVKDFPYTTQWKQFENCDYVLGIEPASCKMLGRAAHAEAGTLDYLEPHSGRDFDVKVEILDGNDSIEAFIRDSGF